MKHNEPATATTVAQEDLMAMLDEYGVEYLILDSRKDGNLLELCQSTPLWTVDLIDRESVLMTRTHDHDLGREHTARHNGDLLAA